MSDDKKMDFYLENRALIEEWAALRKLAVSALDEALLEAARLLADDDRLPEPRITDGQARTVKLHATTDPVACWIELWWQERDLLRGSGGWPWLCVVMNPKHPKPLRDAVRAAVTSAPRSHGLGPSGSQWWLRAVKLTPSSEPIEIEAYAESCLDTLSEAWLDLHATISSAIAAHTGGASEQLPHAGPTLE